MALLEMVHLHKIVQYRDLPESQPVHEPIKNQSMTGLKCTSRLLCWPFLQVSIC